MALTRSSELRINEFGRCSLMSTPTSASASADRSLTAAPGLVPAEYTSTVSPAILLIRPAAICDLPAFLTQTNRTDGLPPTSVMTTAVGGHRGGAEGGRRLAWRRGGGRELRRAPIQRNPRGSGRR